MDDVLVKISQTAQTGNLAAVLVHLNDTYFIEERSDSEIPGMARVAGLIKTIRKFVFDRLGEDRILVLHSGDFLSPSAMSRQFMGQPMVELLNLCDVNYATLGNHEFDFESPNKPRVLASRLAESEFEIVLANLVPPVNDDSYRFLRLAFWPQEKPFLAITGIAGEQTYTKAREKCGFQPLNAIDVAKGILGELELRPDIGALVVLSHMDRAEDKELQKVLSGAWHRDGFVYLLGGHDHHIHWREGDRRNCLLSKCLSNCKSITVFIIPKDGLAALDRSMIRPDLDRQMSSEETIAFVDEEMRQESKPQSELLSKEAIDKQFVAATKQVLSAYRRYARCTRQDFKVAFERRISQALYDLRFGVKEYMRDGILSFFVIDWAVRYAVDEGFLPGSLELSRFDDLFALSMQTPGMSPILGCPKCHIQKAIAV